MNISAVDHDICNLKRECEAKDATIKELTTILQSTKMAGSKVLFLFFCLFELENKRQYWKGQNNFLCLKKNYILVQLLISFVSYEAKCIYYLVHFLLGNPICTKYFVVHKNEENCENFCLIYLFTFTFDK